MSSLRSPQSPFTTGKEKSKMTAKPSFTNRIWSAMDNISTIAAFVVTVALGTLVFVSPTSAFAAAGWAPEVEAPDSAAPGSTFHYWITPRNVGDSPSDGSVAMALDVELPPGITAVALEAPLLAGFLSVWTCDDPVGASTIHCDTSAAPPEFAEFLSAPAGGLIAEGAGFPLGPFVLQVEASGAASGAARVHFSGGGAAAGTAAHTVEIRDRRELHIMGWDGHIQPDDEGRLQAGSHPDDIVTTFKISSREELERFNGTPALSPERGIRDLTADLFAGFVGAPAAVGTCALEDLAPLDYAPREFPPGQIPACPVDSIVGVLELYVASENAGPGLYKVPIFNMAPPAGEPARFGFNVLGFANEISADVRTDGDLGVQLKIRNANQGLPVLGARTTFWGVPSDPSHDFQRCQIFTGDSGECGSTPGDQVEGANSSPSGLAKPFLSLPTSCEGALRFDLALDSWGQPTTGDSASFTDHDDFGNGVSGCDRVPFQPQIHVQPTTDEAETPTGLEVTLTVPPDGIENPTGISQSHLKDAVVTLPEGMTVNPSQANGLAVCTPSQIGLTSGDSRPIRFNRAKPSCPDASQIGEVSLKTPLLKEELKGAVYLAQQSDPSSSGTENPFNSDLALYLAVEGQGVLVKLAGEVAPDPKTGQVVTRFLNNPQQPFERFSFKFKGGQRGPLATPPVCGTHSVKAELTPWARPGQPVTVSDSFKITKGPNGGPCPTGQTPPFKPGILAGTRNNAAGSYSPFDLRLTSNVGEQEFTNFSIKLPPGLSGKLAGIPFCPDAAIAAAADPGRTGRTELAAPSCPAASEVGNTLVGAGVGSLQTYVPGKLYLAGPYHGAPFSVVAVTAAVAGPFDLGAVVVRYALKINPETAEVFVDATGSDPLPHIIKGVVTHIRDIRAHVDRPDFTLNPTSCAPTSVASTVLGSGLDFASPADDVPVTVASRFQAADCAALPYRPRLSLKLRGGTKRGKNPQLTAILRPRPGDANSKKISVALPHSEFLDQSHIKTICTRVQFKAGAGNGAGCPKGSIYGTVKAWTPLLDNPLQGNVYLRSSEHPLPDLVLALHGQVEFTAVGRIDSVKGGIRNTFEAVPDAPISKVEVRFAGGKKSLLVNSTNICKGRHRAKLDYTAHSGKTYGAKAPLQAKCKKGKHKKRAKHRRAR